MLISFFRQGPDAESLAAALGLDAARVTRFELPFGELLAFFPVFESNEAECSMLLKIRPETLPKDAPFLGSGHPIRAYVHDRAYVTSALMAVALSKAFPQLILDEETNGTAVQATLKVSLHGVKSSQDSETVVEWLRPWGYETLVQEANHPVVKGQSGLWDIHLSGTTGLSWMFRHLQVLLCALDQDHVHWIGKEATIAIVNAVQPWLNHHPQFAAIQAAILGMPYNAKRNRMDNLVEANFDQSFPAVRNLYRNSTESDVIIQSMSDLLNKEKCNSILVWFPESEGLALSLCQIDTVHRVSLIDLQPDYLQGIVPKLNAANISLDLKRKIQLQIGSPIYHGDFLAGYDTLVLEGMLDKLPTHNWPAMASSIFVHAKPKIVVAVEPMGKELKAWVAEITKEFPFEAEFLIPKISEAPKAVPMAIVIFKHSPNK